MRGDTKSFGRALRPLWHLAPDAAFLNHGSFGACPRSVLAEQDRIRRRMEAEPDRFFRNEVMPGEEETGIRRVAARIGSFVGVRGEDIALVENATAGAQAVLRSVALAPGDRILITGHTYNAVRLMVQARCAETGAEPVAVELPLPATEDEIVRRIEAAIEPRVKLAIVDHITSPSALSMPLERIVPLLQGRGVRVLVDGAHGVGQVPLDLARLAPDWYTSNAHKWLFAPKGTAFLYSAPRVAGITRPHVVSHYVETPFPRCFDFIGTRDYSAWLALPAAIAFFEDLGPEAARKYQHGLLEPASELLAALGAGPVAPLQMCASMRSFVLPQRRPADPGDAAALMRSLWERHRVQGHASVLGGTLLTRISGQVYVGEEDLRALARALETDGWPGR